MRGNLTGAAKAWNQLGIVSDLAGRPEEAEPWFRKAIGLDRYFQDHSALSVHMSNLATFLRNFPDRLADARQLAEESLAIKKSFGPRATTIWQTYTVLAEIADKQFKVGEARAHRRLAREVKRSSPGARHELRRFAPLILTTVWATQAKENRKRLEAELHPLKQEGWTKLVAAIRGVLAGERNADFLCQDLDLEDAMVIEAILDGLSDPSTLENLREAAEARASN